MPEYGPLCSCAAEPGGVKICCYVALCYCCAAGDIARFAAEKSPSHSEKAGTLWCGVCCANLMCPCIAPCYNVMMRTILTMSYEIEDPHASSACCMFCCGCGPCLICQEYNMVLKYKDGGDRYTSGSDGSKAPGQQGMGAAPAVVPSY